MGSVGEKEAVLLSGYPTTRGARALGRAREYIEAWQGYGGAERQYCGEERSVLNRKSTHPKEGAQGLRTSTDIEDCILLMASRARSFTLCLDPG